MCVTCIGWARKQAIYGEHGRGWSVRQGGRFVGNVCEPASHLSLVKHRLAQKLHPVSWPEESSFSSSPFSGLAHKVTALSLCAQTNAHSSKHVVMCIVRAIHLHHQRCCWKDFTACLAPTPPHRSPCSWESLHWIPHCLSSKGTDISWCTLHSTWCSMQWYCSYCKSHLI